MLLTKVIHQIFRLLTACIKFHQIPHVTFRTKSQCFIKNFASLFSDMRHNSPVLSHLSLYMLWANGAQQSANFLHHPSVSWHNSSEIFWLKHYILWTKRAHNCTIFQTFKYSNESSPSSSYHF